MKENTKVSTMQEILNKNRKNNNQKIQKSKEKVRKVPVILQMEAVECGAACLAMILAYYKKFIPLEKLRMECSVSRDGSNARNVLKSARSHGLIAKGFSYRLESLKTKVNMPAIIHWQFNHFVVLCGFKKEKAILADPAIGIVSVPMDEFEKSFTGIVLNFQPSKDFIPEGKKKSFVNFLTAKIKNEKNSFILLLLCGFMLSLANSLLAFLAKIFSDNILFYSARQFIWPILMIISALALIIFILDVFQSLFLLKIKGKMSVKSSAELMWHILSLPIEFFSQRFVGDITARQESVPSLIDIICTKIFPVFLNLFMVVLYLIVLIYYDLTMAFVGILASILNLLILNIGAKANSNDNRALMRDSGKLAGTASAGINLIETIKANGAEASFFQKWSGYQTKFNNTLQRLKQRSITISSAPVLIFNLANTIILVLGVYNILSGKFTIGTLLSFQGFIALMYDPLSDLVYINQNMQKANGTMERIDDILNYPVDINIDFKEITDKNLQDKNFVKLKGQLSIRNLHFAYSPLAKPLIKDFNLEIEPGKTVALIGNSGSGKSTIAKIIAGLYKPTSGQILFDGIEQEKIDRNIFRNSLAVVDQEISLFEDNIRNNIAMWDKTIEENTIIKAAKDADIHDDIIMRGDGYDHILSENGKDFSGGQRQRIEIARAFAINPSILILDEATSALDPTTEKHVMDSVKQKKITCIVVAHRLSTIRDADEIIVLEKGHVVERGKHEDLILKNGKYAELIKSE